MTTVETSSDLHFADLQRLRPFEVYIDATENYLIVSMAGSRQIVANCRDGRVNAYLICAVLNTAVHPDVLAALQGIVADDDPGVSLKDQRARWNDRMALARAAISKATGAA